LKRPNRDLPKIHVDFNNTDADGFVRLNTVGVTNDLARLNIALVDGLRLCATDNEYALEGTVRVPGREGTWRLQVDWDEFKPQVVREYDRRS
jgi:hypothetical protein